MSDLYSINTKLSELQRLIGASNLELGIKQEELDRLQQALIDLRKSKNSFMNSKYLCLQPRFSQFTFQGENANKLTAFKEEELQTHFIAISNDQINDAIETINDQVQILETKIEEIESNISSMEAQFKEVSEEKAEVENKP